MFCFGEASQRDGILMWAAGVEGLNIRATGRHNYSKLLEATLMGVFRMKVLFALSVVIGAWMVVASFLTVVDAVKSVPAYFVFGDSVLDVGENNYVPNAEYHANFPPYGETFFHRPTGRFSNGRNLGDFFGVWLLTLFWNNSVASDLKMWDGWGQISSLARDFLWLLVFRWYNLAEILQKIQYQFWTALAISSCYRMFLTVQVGKKT